MNRIARFAGGLAVLSLPVTLFGLPACTSSAPTSTFGASATSPPPQAAPALAALQTRDRIVHLYGGDHGALFATVHDDAGHLVADGVSLDALRAIDPFLYEACTSAVARGGSGGSGASGAFLDARFYPLTDEQNGKGEPHSNDVGSVDSPRLR